MKQKKRKPYEERKNFNSLELYGSWNFTTACCYKYRTKCILCPNQLVCSQFEDEEYMHPIKKATMMTLKNIGIEGIERFINYDTRDEQA